MQAPINRSMSREYIHLLVQIKKKILKIMYTLWI